MRLLPQVCRPSVLASLLALAVGKLTVCRRVACQGLRKLKRLLDPGTAPGTQVVRT